MMLRWTLEGLCNCGGKGRAAGKYPHNVAHLRSISVAFGARRRFARATGLIRMSGERSAVAFRPPRSLIGDSRARWRTSSLSLTCINANMTNHLEASISICQALISRISRGNLPGDFQLQKHVLGVHAGLLEIIGRLGQTTEAQSRSACAARPGHRTREATAAPEFGIDWFTLHPA